jgi:hypothetical protein
MLKFKVKSAYLCEQILMLLFSIIGSLTKSSRTLQVTSSDEQRFIAAKIPYFKPIINISGRDAENADPEVKSSISELWLPFQEH